LGEVWHVNPDVESSENIVYFRVFFISVSTSMGTKKGRYYGKGAPFKVAPQTFEGAQLPQTTALDPPLACSN